MKLKKSDIIFQLCAYHGFERAQLEDVKLPQLKATLDGAIAKKKVAK